MLMKVTTDPDFHFVEPQHKVIHKDLENWALYIRVRPQSWMGPIWKLGRSHGRQWHSPEILPPIRPLDAMEIEKLVRELPKKQRAAIRWNYVYRDSPAKAIRQIGTTYQGLAELVRIGRVMLINMKKTC